MTSSLTNMLHTLSKEKYWRIRKAVVELAIVIGTHCTDVETFNDYEIIFLKGLFDNAQKIRSKTVHGINVLAKHFGADWVSTHVLPRLDQAWSAEDVT